MKLLKSMVKGMKEKLSQYERPIAEVIKFKGKAEDACLASGETSREFDPRWGSDYDFGE